MFFLEKNPPKKYQSRNHQKKLINKKKLQKNKRLYQLYLKNLYLSIILLHRSTIISATSRVCGLMLDEEYLSLIVINGNNYFLNF